MATVQIRNLDDAAYDVLRTRAAESGRSLQEYLRLELERLAGSRTVSEALAEVRVDLRWRGPELTADELVDLVHAGRSR